MLELGTWITAFDVCSEEKVTDYKRSFGLSDVVFSQESEVVQWMDWGGRRTAWRELDESWYEKFTDVCKYLSYVFSGQTYNLMPALWKAMNDLTE